MKKKLTTILLVTAFFCRSVLIAVSDHKRLVEQSPSDLRGCRICGECCRSFGGGKPAFFIVFAVIGQEGLWDDTGNRPIIQYNGAIIQLSQNPNRRPDQRSYMQLSGQFRKTLYRSFAILQQRLLQKQILTGIASQTEFREQGNPAPLFVRLPDLCRDSLGIPRYIGHFNGRNAAGHPDKVIHMDHPLFNMRLFYYGGKNTSIKKDCRRQSFLSAIISRLRPYPPRKPALRSGPDSPF